MLGIIVWLFFTFLGCLLLYAIIKAAINHSDIGNQSESNVIISNQLNRQHQEMMGRMDELKQAIIEQNRLMSEVVKFIPKE